MPPTVKLSVARRLVDGQGHQLSGRKYSASEKKELHYLNLIKSYQHRRQLLTDTVTSTEIAKILGCQSRQTPLDRVNNQTLLAVKDNGQWRYPLWQLDPEGTDGVIEGLPEVLKALQVSNLAKVSWLTRHQAQIIGSTFLESNLEKADLQKTSLEDSNFSNAILKKANLENSKLIETDFREANFNEASLETATLKKCSVYGTSFLKTNFKNVKTKNVYISPEGKEGLPVDDLALASCTYLQRYHPLLIQKFIHICDLEKELVRLANTLVDKYGEYSHTYNSRIFTNYQAENQSPPFVEVKKENNYLRVELLPDYSSKGL